MLQKLTKTENVAWNRFVTVVWRFLRNHKAENYVEHVETVVKNYAKMGYKMFHNVYILDTRLRKFKENMGSYSEKKAERFHQDILNC